MALSEGYSHKRTATLPFLKGSLMKNRPVLPLILLSLTLITLLGTLFWAQCWAFIPEIGVFMSMFHKHCPAASEEARYPADIDILISSRVAPGDYLESRVALLPGGQHIIYEPGEDYESHRLYNLDTQQDTPYRFPESLDSIEAYLTDEWVVVGQVVGSRRSSHWTFSLWNRTTGAMIAMDTINTEKYLAQGIPSDLQPLIQAHPIVYLTGGDLILIPTSVGDPDGTATLIRGYMDYPYPQAIATIATHLRALGVEPIILDTLDSPDQTMRIEPATYTTLPFGDFENMSYRSTVIDVESGTTILTSSLDFFEPRGWAAGQRGVVLVSESRCTSRLPLIGCTSDMAQPIVLQRQNPDYLSATQQATFAAQDAQEATAKHNAQTVMGMLLLASGVLGIVTLATTFSPLTRKSAVAPGVAFASTRQ